MKNFFTTSFLVLLVYGAFAQNGSLYLQNKAPLKAKPYLSLPLGAIKPKGFLLEQLKRQKTGLTGNLDKVYSKSVGKRNGWLGGDGDGWERGPYWIDGLLPLAYTLNDKALKAKANKWVDWTLENQREDGYLGPIPFKTPPPKEKGLQKDRREDWWPKMVMLKILKQHYSATGDKRVLKVLSKYFKYQLKKLPEKPLGHWSFWANRRGGDNLAVVYWLYNITGEKFLLDLGEIIFKQTRNWTDIYGKGHFRQINPLPGGHCVNVSQGLKQPAIYYQRHPEAKYLDVIKYGLTDLKNYFGYVTGMYGADEGMHSNDPTQGSELCTAVEMMYSFENILPISGDIYYADYLEKVAYNVLPTQIDDHFQNKQYFQQVNQVQITNERRNFFNDLDARICYGVLSGFPCCTTNMHQGWPKFVQNLWYATPDKGIAALVYGPSEVTLKVANGKKITITEDTDYPFRDIIKFTVKTKTRKDIKFPFHLRIPKWCKKGAIVKINNDTIAVISNDTIINNNPTVFSSDVTGGIVKIDRKWKKGDVITLHLPMEFRFSKWVENSLGIERGPLVYALKVEEKWLQASYPDNWRVPNPFYEVYPKSPWNYGITVDAIRKKDFKITVSDKVASYPWNLKNAPIAIKTKGKKIDFWGLYNGSAGKMPISPVWHLDKVPQQEITLIPYGCTTLRIAQFPVVGHGHWSW